MAPPLKSQIKLINGTFYVNVEAAAQICGVSTTTMHRWRKQPDAPPFDDKLKMYPLTGLGDWVRKVQPYRRGNGGSYEWCPPLEDHPYYVKPKTRNSSPVVMLPGMEPPEPEFNEDYETRIKRLKGDELQMKLNERAGELVNADELLISLSSMISRVKTRLLSLPTALAVTVTGKVDRVEVQAMIEDKLHAALEELSTDPMKDMSSDDGV